ncbi:MAG: hypothetical protein IBX72_15720 [Nitrospirae bacterium]|nr:hypothetical protein [Nitrospirota bacterium]MBE0428073.1 hypothetical protein [Nitrospirota bacterium]
MARGIEAVRIRIAGIRNGCAVMIKFYPDGYLYGNLSVQCDEKSSSGKRIRRDDC